MRPAGRIWRRLMRRNLVAAIAVATFMLSAQAIAATSAAPEGVTHAAVAQLRAEELYKLPGVGETITWARALLALGDGASLEETLGVALKVREDVDRVRENGVLSGA